MNVFRLTKHCLVSIIMFSKQKNRRKSSFLMPFLTFIFIKLPQLIYAFLKKTLPILNDWRVNGKYYLISFWVSVRIKIAPFFWVFFDTIGIIINHIKATVLPIFWQLRYWIEQFLLRNKASPSAFFEPKINALEHSKEQTKALVAAVLVQANNQLMSFCPPSVKTRLERGKETFVFLWMTMVTRQLTKKQTIVTWIIIVFCSMAHIRKADSLLDAHKPIRIENGAAIREYELGGMLQTTLYNSLKDNDLSPMLIAMVKEALKNRIDFKQCTLGDEYKLIWEETPIEGQFEPSQQLTSVYYKGQNTYEPIYVFYYNHEMLGGWYGKEGLPTQGGLDSPVLNGKITSRFDWHRKHPILGFRRPHLGTDYAAKRGTPILSVADGVVEEAKFRSGNGRYVKIKHGQNYATEYLHMSRYGADIEQGATVKKRQIIGYIGMSGLTTGPHVCFRVLKNGKAIDPLAELSFTNEDHAQFEKVMMEKKAQLDNISVIKPIN